MSAPTPRRRGAAGRAVAALLLAAATLPACDRLAWFDPAPPRERIDRAVDDARDPVERGGERGVPRSAPAYDRRP